MKCTFFHQIKIDKLMYRLTSEKGNNRFNPFPHDKILDQTKLKAFADERFNVTKMIISVFDRVKNIVGKGEIACTGNFSFSTMFSEGFFPNSSKGVIVWEWVKQAISHLFR